MKRTGTHSLVLKNNKKIIPEKRNKIHTNNKQNIDSNSNTKYI